VAARLLEAGSRMARLSTATAVSASDIAWTPRVQSTTTGGSCARAAGWPGRLRTRAASAGSISLNFGAAARVGAAELRHDALEGPRSERQQQPGAPRLRTREDRAEVLRERPQH
jgi:hypothetical protein